MTLRMYVRVLDQTYRTISLHRGKGNNVTHVVTTYYYEYNTVGHFVMNHV